MPNIGGIGIETLLDLVYPGLIKNKIKLQKSEAAKVEEPHPIKDRNELQRNLVRNPEKTIKILHQKQKRKILSNKKR